MKAFNELTEEEILNLTEEEIGTHIDFACAESGVKLMRGKSAPTLPDYHKIGGGDLIIYDVCNISFKNKEEAHALYELLKNSNSITSWAYGDSYGDSLKKETTPPSIDQRTHTVCSKDFVEKQKELLIENKEKQTQFETVRDQFNKDAEAYYPIEGAIYDKLNNVREKYAEFNRLNSEFQSYLGLSDNDFDTAMKFFKRAFAVSEEATEYIVQAYVYQRKTNLK